MFLPYETRLQAVTLSVGPQTCLDVSEFLEVSCFPAHFSVGTLETILGKKDVDKECVTCINTLTHIHLRGLFMHA